MLDESKRIPNKIWVDNGNEFNNKTIKSCYKDNNIEIEHIMEEDLLLLKDLVRL